MPRSVTWEREIQDLPCEEDVPRLRLIEVDMRPTSKKEPAMPYRSKKLVTQTVSKQRLALWHRPHLNPELEEEVLSSPAVYQEVEDEFMINYLDVPRKTLNNINSEPNDNLNNIATGSSSTHTIKQTPTIPGADAMYVLCFGSFIIFPAYLCTIKINIY